MADRYIPARLEQRPQLVCHGYALGFGVMKNDRHLVVHANVKAQRYGQWPTMAVNLQRHELDIRAHINLQNRLYEYRFKQKLGQILSIHSTEEGDELIVVIQMKLPPYVARRSYSDNWRRQTIVDDQRQAATQPASLFCEDAFIQPGRWLTYCFIIRDLMHQNEWVTLSRALSMIPSSTERITITTEPSRRPWQWLHSIPPSSTQTTTSPYLAMLHLAATQVVLPYNVMYQLEVCISHGYLREPNLNHAFALKLSALDQESGVKGMAQYLLEHIAGLKQHFADPMDIFRYQHEVKGFRPKPPSYCITLQSATVTPTTIYFHTPTVEMSNRVLRKYSQFDRHFLRVKFRDEHHLGRVRASDDRTDDEVFRRFERALKRGITVGGRLFEFLAYGNSQLRENGAYFFARTPELCAEDLRRRMGTFNDIKVVAKYASRLGQSFSTTRTSWNQVDIAKIPDITRNGYCFSDGVGKMSSFVARMIAEHINLPSSTIHCPSAYQFRLGGYKGIIVVDPRLTGRTIELRPSQDKFPADHKGLEICRAAHYSASFLNQQIILLLSCLGVTDEAIIERQDKMVTDLQLAMRDQHMAIKLLLKSVDQNRTTETLANMIQDGFMRVQEPFFMSCLRLWRSWSVKWLKEKARILVPEGTFLLGCVDETGLLSGHFDHYDNHNPLNKKSTLPQVFVQILTTDPKNPSVSISKIITGLCVVARNPSLHPGDVRVVEAVDIPELHHLRNVAVFPQTGDRDIPGMCSGGDLDGDDYLVIWDQDMIPTEWNHESMDYTPPAPNTRDGEITVDDITTFFVEHMRCDNLGRIATAHRYWADLKDEGPKHQYCLELAALHSRAVDYAKTGVPAQMAHHLKVNNWPRWAGKINVPPQLIYDSDKILHRLYRGVDFVEFVPAQKSNFDKRILEASVMNDELLQSVRTIKDQYDTAIRRLMSLHEIKSEYEVWTTFVLNHNEEVRDWTLAESLGNALSAIKHQHRQMIFEAAGTTSQEQDVVKLKPYIVAMYTATAQDSASEQDVANSGDEDDVTSATTLVSFPWIFQRELGLIAKDQFGPSTAAEVTSKSAATVPLPASPELDSEPTISSPPTQSIEERGLEPLITVDEKLPPKSAEADAQTRVSAEDVIFDDSSSVSSSSSTSSEDENAEQPQATVLNRLAALLGAQNIIA